jgi:hypothetical protein
MQSQLKNNVTRILHDKAHCSRYDNISTWVGGASPFSFIEITGQ